MIYGDTIEVVNLPMITLFKFIATDERSFNQLTLDIEKHGGMAYKVVNSSNSSDKVLDFYAAVNNDNDDEAGLFEYYLNTTDYDKWLRKGPSLFGRVLCWDLKDTM